MIAAVGKCGGCGGRELLCVYNVQSGVCVNTIKSYEFFPGLLRNVKGVAFSDAGYMFVTSSRNQILVFDDERNFVVSHGAYGSDRAQYDNATALAFYTSMNSSGMPQGNLVVCDAGNKRVQVIEAETGEQVLEFDLRIAHPTSVAVGTNGPIAVVDRENKRVQVFDLSGKHQMTLGDGGHLSSPYAVAIGVGGEFLVSDKAANRIQIFHSNGVFWRTIVESGAGCGSPRGIAVDTTGRIFAATRSSDFSLRMFY